MTRRKVCPECHYAVTAHAVTCPRRTLDRSDEVPEGPLGDPTRFTFTDHERGTGLAGVYAARAALRKDTTT